MYLTSIVFLYKVDHIIPLLMKELHWDQLLSSLMNSFFLQRNLYCSMFVLHNMMNYMALSLLL